MDDSKQQNGKIRDFMAKEIIGYKNYRVKILQMTFLVHFWGIECLF